MADEQLELYAVRNQAGQWFHRKGYGGSADTWQDDFVKARIYNKIGPARAIVTFFSKRWPQYGIPNLVKLVVSKAELIDETERIEKLNKKEAAWQANAEQRAAKRTLAIAEKALEHAKGKVAALKTEVVK